MEPRAKYFRVGLIVILAVIGFTLASLWLSQVRDTQGSETYTIYFENQSLSGLQVDSNVAMKGIKVGSVSEMDISPQNIEQVRVEVQLDADTPIRTDTRAIIRRNLLTGLATIELVGSTQETPPLVEIPEGEKQPVILEGKAELDEIRDSIPGLIDKLGQTLGHMQALFSEKNVLAVERTLENLEIVSGAVASNSEDLEKGIVALSSVSQTIDGISKDIGKFVNDTDKRFEEISNSVNTSLGSITNSADTVQSEVKDVGDSFQGASDTFSQSLNEMAKSINRLAKTLSSTLEAYENPQSILSKPGEDVLGPGEGG